MEHEILQHSGQGDNPRSFTQGTLEELACFQHHAVSSAFQPVSSSTPIKVQGQRASPSNSMALVPSPESKEKEPPTHSRFSLGSVGNRSLGPPLFSSSLLNESSQTLLTGEMDLNLDSLDQSQIKEAMESLLVENSVLKEELQSKSKQLKTAKLQVQALIDLEDSLDLEIGTSALKQNRSRKNSPIPVPESLKNASIRTYKRKREGMSDISIAKTINQELMEPEVVNLNDNDTSTDDGNAKRSNRAPPIRMLPEHTFILIREITSRIEVHQVREKMIEGLHFSNQLVVGGAAGWIGAFLVKKFGKTAITALGGGIFLLIMAKRKGFVEVNWSPIFQELDRTIEARLITSSVNEESPAATNEDWPLDKVQRAKDWLVQHSVAGFGFLLGFSYNLVQN